MQPPALPHHMLPLLLPSDRSSFMTWFVFSLYHSQRSLHSITASALSGRAGTALLALPLTCGLWTPGSAAWHTPGCTLEPVTLSREQAKRTFSISGLGATVAPARAAFQPYHTSHLYQDSAILGKQSHGISCPQCTLCSQYHLHADIQHKWDSE